MKKFLSLVLALVMTMSLVTISAGATEYKDLTDKDEIQYEEAVAVLNRIGIITGYEDGSFQPERELTRGAAAKIIVSLLIGPEAASNLPNTSSPYPDVPADHTFAGVISFCKTEGIISGYGDGTFKPANSLTGSAFAKMLLGALGYDSKIQGYTDTGWTMNVLRDANYANLLNRIEFDGGAAVNRETACQLALNTLKATMVEYTGGLNITAGDATVTSTPTLTYKISNQSYATNISNRKASNLGNATMDNHYTVEFGEEHFKDLRLNDEHGTKYTTDNNGRRVLNVARDDFGRPSNKWSYKKVTIGTFPIEPDYVYTERVIHVDDVKVTDAAKVRALELSGFNLATDDREASSDYVPEYTTLWVNGAEHLAVIENNKWVSPLSKVADIANYTDNGTVVEVYVSEDDSDFIQDVVVIKTQLMEIKNVKSEAVSLKLYDDGSDHKGENAMGFNNIPIDKDVNDVELNDECFTTLSGMKVGDIVAVIPVAPEHDGSEPKYDVNRVYAPETVSGELTWVDTYGIERGETNGIAVTVGGTDYDVALWNKDLTDIDGTKIRVTRKDVTLYLDEFGNALLATDVGSTSDFMVIGGYHSGLVDGKVVTYADGWDIKGNEISLNIGNARYDTIGGLGQYAAPFPIGSLVHYSSSDTSKYAEWNIDELGVFDVASKRTGETVEYKINASNSRVVLNDYLYKDVEHSGAAVRGTASAYNNSASRVEYTKINDTGLYEDNTTPYNSAYDSTVYVDDDGVKVIYLSIGDDGEVDNVEIKDGMQNISNEEILGLNSEFALSVQRAQACVSLKDSKDADGNVVDTDKVTNESLVKAIVVKLESGSADLKDMIYVSRYLGSAGKAAGADNTQRPVYGYAVHFVGQDNWDDEVTIYSFQKLDKGDFARSRKPASYPEGVKNVTEDNFYTLTEYSRIKKALSTVNTGIIDYGNGAADKLGPDGGFNIQGSKTLIRMADYRPGGVGEEERANFATDYDPADKLDLGDLDITNILSLRGAKFIDLTNRDIQSASELVDELKDMNKLDANGLRHTLAVSALYNDDTSSDGFRDVHVLIITSDAISRPVVDLDTSGIAESVVKAFTFVRTKGNDENKTESFSTIAAALRGAEAGDTIRVNPVTVNGVTWRIEFKDVVTGIWTPNIVEIPEEGIIEAHIVRDGEAPATPVAANLIKPSLPAGDTLTENDVKYAVNGAGAYTLAELANTSVAKAGDTITVVLPSGYTASPASFPAPKAGDAEVPFTITKSDAPTPDPDGTKVKVDPASEEFVTGFTWNGNTYDTIDDVIAAGAKAGDEITVVTAEGYTANPATFPLPSTEDTDITIKATKDEEPPAPETVNIAVSGPAGQTITVRDAATGSAIGEPVTIGEDGTATLTLESTDVVYVEAGDPAYYANAYNTNKNLPYAKAFKPSANVKINVYLAGEMKWGSVLNSEDRVGISQYPIEKTGDVETASRSLSAQAVSYDGPTYIKFVIGDGLYVLAEGQDDYGATIYFTHPDTETEAAEALAALVDTLNDPATDLNDIITTIGQEEYDDGYTTEDDTVKISITEKTEVADAVLTGVDEFNSCKVGDPVTLTVTKLEGYPNVVVTANGVTLTAEEDGTYIIPTTTAGTVEVKVTATAEPVDDTVTVTVTKENVADAVLTGVGEDGSCKVGDVVTLTVTALEDYPNVVVTANGTVLSAGEDGKYIIPTTTAGEVKVEVTATAEPVEPVAYTVTYDAEQVDVTVEGGESPVLPGTKITLTIASKEGFVVTGVTVNGAPVEQEDFSTVEVTISEETAIVVASESAVVSNIIDRLTITVTPDEIIAGMEDAVVFDAGADVELTADAEVDTSEADAKGQTITLTIKALGDKTFNEKAVDITLENDNVTLDQRLPKPTDEKTLTVVVTVKVASSSSLPSGNEELCGVGINSGTAYVYTYDGEAAELGDIRNAIARAKNVDVSLVTVTEASGTITATVKDRFGVASDETLTVTNASGREADKLKNVTIEGKTWQLGPYMTVENCTSTALMNSADGEIGTALTTGSAANVSGTYDAATGIFTAGGKVKEGDTFVTALTLTKTVLENHGGKVLYQGEEIAAGADAIAEGAKIAVEFNCGRTGAKYNSTGPVIGVLQDQAYARVKMNDEDAVVVQGTRTSAVSEEFAVEGKDGECELTADINLYKVTYDGDPVTDAEGNDLFPSDLSTATATSAVTFDAKKNVKAFVLADGHDFNSDPTETSGTVTYTPNSADDAEYAKDYNGVVEICSAAELKHGTAGDLYSAALKLNDDGDDLDGGSTVSDLSQATTIGCGQEAGFYIMAEDVNTILVSKISTVHVETVVKPTQGSEGIFHVWTEGPNIDENTIIVGASLSISATQNGTNDIGASLNGSTGAVTGELTVNTAAATNASTFKEGKNLINLEFDGVDMDEVEISEVKLPEGITAEIDDSGMKVEFGITNAYAAPDDNKDNQTGYYVVIAGGGLEMKIELTISMKKAA